jgi:hypothetical protein
MVIEKGKSYGDSIGSPVRIFSKAGAKDGLQVRIDDKLSRIAKGSEFQGDDTLKDLVGYLALLATERSLDFPATYSVPAAKRYNTEEDIHCCEFGLPIALRYADDQMCGDFKCLCKKGKGKPWHSRVHKA